MNYLNKILFAIVFCVWAVGTVQAQVDRSEPPKPGSAPEIEFEKPETFTLDNGLKVIVSENHEMPVVSFQLAVDVDPVKEGDAVGYISAAGNLLRNGTKNREKAEIDEAVDFIGAQLSTFQNGVYGSSLSKHEEELLEIMADIVKNPTFPEEEVEKYKKKAISGLASSKTNASFIAQRVARKLRNEDHPYGELETESSIENITRNLCMDYYNTYYKPNVSYLVMVGDITPDEAKQYAETYFGDWEQGQVPTHEYEFPEREKGTRVAMVNKEDAVQSYISVTYPVDLSVGKEDAIEASVMNNILGGGVFSGYLMQNLREDKGYTYGARSSLSRDPEVGYFSASAEVGTEVTDSAVNEFLYEMNRIRNEKVEPDHLEMVQNVMTGQFARSLENARTVARFALNTERYNLPSDYYANYLEKVEEVTEEDVQMAAEKYILPDEAIVLVVGDKEKVAEKLKKFSEEGKIEMYSNYGEPVKESRAIPANLTAEKVIEKYIQAMGGRANIQKIETMKQVGSVSMQGRTITIKTFQQAPDKFANVTEMNGMTVQKQVYNGEKGKVTAMGQQQDIEGDQLENLKFEAKMFKFLRYDELGVQLELKGVEQVDGKDAYKIQVTNPTGSTHYDFYDVDSGLKVKTKSKQQTPQGEVTTEQQFKNYKEVNGVKFPYTIQISGMRNMTMEIQSYEVNEDIDESVFTL